MNDQFIPINQFSRPGTKRAVTRNIVWHYTANPGATAIGHFHYFGENLAQQNPNDNVKDVYASAHIFIDPTEVLCIIPLDEVAYHASQANPYSVGVELCIEKDGTFHPDTIKQAVAVGVELARMYNLNPLTDFIRHFDVTGKICPKPWTDNPDQWEAFKQQVSAEMKGGVPTLEKWVAQTIVNTWLKPAWNKANEAGNETDKKNIRLLANKLRLACGMKEDEEFE